MTVRIPIEILVKFALVCMLILGRTCYCQSAFIPLDEGLVVEEVTKGTEAQKAGLQPGDILLDWKQGKAQGDLWTPFNLSFVETEEGSRGAVWIEGSRHGRKLSWRLASDHWAFSVRPNLRGLLLSIYEEAHELESSGKREQSVARWKNAATTAQNMGISWLGCWFLSRGASVAFSAQLWSLSDELYQEASNLAVRAEPRISAAIFTDWGNALSHREDPAGAEKCYQQALAEWGKLEIEPVSISAGLLRLGYMAVKRADPSKAREYYQEALKVAGRTAPRSRYVAAGLEALGTDAMDRGDLRVANNYLRQALAIEEALYPQDKAAGWTLETLGHIAFQLGDFKQAAAYFERSLGVTKKQDPRAYQIAWTLDNLALTALGRKDNEGAERYAARAFAISEKMAWGGTTLAESLLVLGRVADAQGQLSTSEDYYKRGLRISEESSSKFESSMLMAALGDLARRENRFNKAEEYYRMALEASESIGPENFDRELTMAALAGTLRQEGQLNLAAQTYEEFLGTIENQTIRVGGSFETISSFRARHAANYGEYSDLLLAQNQPKHAFEVLERSRAQTLLDMLASAQIDIREGADPVLTALERDLNHSISAKSSARLRLLNGQHSQAEVSVVEKEIADLLARQREVKGRIREASPNYAALTQPKALTAHEIQELLDQDTILLEYSLGEERSYVWLVTSNSIDPYLLPKRKVIEGLARRVYACLTARNIAVPGDTHMEAVKRWEQAEIEYEKSSAELSQIVFGPVASLLGQKRLLIVGEGALNYVPFAALPAPHVPSRATNQADSSGSKKMSLGRREPLILQHEIVNLPSASLLAELRREAQGRPHPVKAVAVLADPVFDPDDQRVKSIRTSQNSDTRRLNRPEHDGERSGSRDMLRSMADIRPGKRGSFYLSRLIFTRKEAEGVLAHTPPGSGLKALDFLASRTMAMSPMLGQYRFVHFATHGILNNQHPELSGLVLSLVDKQGKPQDGFLELEDIYNMRLPVDLVVLSGCETGLGREVSGEGLIGLTRGFMYAGASRVVASLWSVSDEATADLMTHFYKFMERDGMRPAAALRAAQIQMWRHGMWKAPYYWAAFQIQGEWQ